jgi:hypothetical protein
VSPGSGGGNYLSGQRTRRRTKAFYGTQAYTPRPVTSFITNTITAITKRRWIKPPATWKTEKPRSHNTTKMNDEGQSILVIVILGLRPVQALSSVQKKEHPIARTTPEIEIDT